VRKSLTAFIAVFGLVCCGIALTHIVLGPRSIPGSIPVNATMDSEDRFYATLFLGFGAALLWCARNLTARANLFRALMLVFFLGGLARIVSAVAVGPPSPIFIFLGSIELILPPILILLLGRSIPAAVQDGIGAGEGRRRDA
jgi:hypothetical protein